MNMKRQKCVLISDFNIDNLAAYLANNIDPPAIETVETPFGQVIPILMQKDATYWQNKPDVALIWTRPDGVIESFKRVLNYEPVPIEEILVEVDNFAALLLEISAHATNIFVPIWVLPTYYRGLGLLDLKSDLGFGQVLLQMNLRLTQALQDIPNIYPLNTQKWVESAGKKAFNPKLWYRGKIPFGNDVFAEAVTDIKAALNGIEGQAKKLIILDLDDTLWGGIVGDAGWENIRLGGHDYIGEAHVDFQQALKSLTNRGLLLGIVSKNEEAVALEAIKRHPEMVLRLEDFAGWRINWQDKAQNVVDLTADLNLGLQSVVFIDDNPVERARVRDALPEVYVPDWPQDKVQYTSTLLSLRCFDTPIISQEDKKRAQMYAVERQRQVLKKQVGSLDDWLSGLEIKVEIETLQEATLQRTAQLLNKTNQMNLTTRRMTEAELMAWVDQENHFLWTFRVSDKFGEAGLTGIISYEIKENVGRIVDFILSCRVMGRKIEETMFYTVLEHAQTMGIEEIYAKYIKTEKNKPCFDFWLNASGCMYNQKNSSFHWPLSKSFARPSFIKIQGLPQFAHV